MHRVLIALLAERYYVIFSGLISVVQSFSGQKDLYMEKAQDRENVVVPNDLGALGCYYTDFSGHALMLDLITNFKLEVCGQTF